MDSESLMLAPQILQKEASDQKDAYECIEFEFSRSCVKLLLKAHSTNKI